MSTQNLEQENWQVSEQGSDLFITNDDGVIFECLFDAPRPEDVDRKRAMLAAAAPQMARLLKDIYDLYDTDTGVTKSSIGDVLRKAGMPR